MYLSEKAFAILDYLLSKPGFTTTGEVAVRLEMSGRSVREYMKEIKGVLDDLGYPFIIKPGIGVRIDVDAAEKQKIQALFEKNHAQPGTQAERCSRILWTLLRNRDFYTMQLLADDMFVSKRLVMKDLEEAEKWLKKRNLAIVRKPNLGLKVEGSEFDIRQALSALNNKVIEEGAESPAGKPLQPGRELDYRLSPANYAAIGQLYKSINLFEVQRILGRSEETLGHALTGDAFFTMFSNLVILLDRLKALRSIEEGAKDGGHPVLPDGAYAESHEYAAAKWIVRQFEAAFGVHIPHPEIGYVAVCFLGADTQHSAEDIEQSFQALEPEYVEICRSVIKLLGNILEVNLQNDMVLLKGLSLHLKRAVIRTRYNITISNPLLSEVKKNYSSIFCSCWAANSVLEKYAGLMFNEDEISFLTLYIGSAVVRQKAKLNAALVCTEGFGTSQLIAGRIEREINGVAVTHLLSVFGINPEVLRQVDFIVTTTNIDSAGFPVARISEKLTEKDIASIRETVRSLLYKKRDKEDASYLLSMVQKKIVLLDGDWKTQQEVLKNGSQLMNEKGFVTAGFYNDILQRESIVSTSMGNGVAIPHGVYGNIVSTGICLVRLAKPVVWSGDKVDLVFILALNFGNVQETRDFFRCFYTVLNNAETLGAIRKAGDVAQIEEIITGGIG